MFFLVVFSSKLEGCQVCQQRDPVQQGFLTGIYGIRVVKAGQKHSVLKVGGEGECIGFV